MRFTTQQPAGGSIADSQTLLHCPMCLAQFVVERGSPPTAPMKCYRCGRDFSLGESLGQGPARDDSSYVPPPYPKERDLDLASQLAVAMGACAVCWLSTLPIESMKGPAFLLYYAFVGIALLLVCWTLRTVWRDSWLITLWGFLAFEALGVWRYYTGTQAGMQKWEIMTGMMVLGGLLFWARVQREGGLFGRRSDGSCNAWFSSGSSCSSGSSGCGGGGCGGGGCGGCGS